MTTITKLSIATLALAMTAGPAPALQERPFPKQPREVVDCGDAGTAELCGECYAGDLPTDKPILACCSDPNNCDVIPPTPPAPAPSRWRLPSARLGQNLYFSR